MRRLALFALLSACASSFTPSSIGLRQTPGDEGGFRYVHRDSGVGFVMPAMAREGDREQDEAGFERVVLRAQTQGHLYRVVVFRPIDGTSVHPAEAITRLADGLIAGQTPDRDEMTMVGTHAARRITLRHANSSGNRVAFLITADDRALAMMELVAEGDVDAAADAFFSTLELGCDH